MITQPGWCAMILPKTEVDRITAWTEQLRDNKAGLGLAVDVDKGKIAALHLTNGGKDAPTMVIPVAMLGSLGEVAGLLNGGPK
jgi:hypothetical protein